MPDRTWDGVTLMDDNYSQMTTQELLATRKRLEDDLADYEEMATFHSLNSPAHATVTERKRESTKLERMRSAIAEIDSLLSQATR